MPEPTGQNYGLHESFFPLTEDAKDIVAELVEDQPDLGFARAEMSMFDPRLSNVAGYMIRGWAVPEELQADFADGCIFTYQLMLSQATLLGTRLPETELDIANEFFADLTNKGDWDDYTEKLVDQASEHDPHFYEAVHDYLETYEDELEEEERMAFLFGSFALRDFLSDHYQLLDMRRGISQAEEQDQG